MTSSDTGTEGGRRVLFASASMSEGNGGIARVARMCVRALGEGGFRVVAVALHDGPSQATMDPRVLGFGGSKLLFATWNLAALAKRGAVLFDSIGPARVRPSFTSKLRPFAVWMHGLEAWEPLRADYRAVLRRARMVFTNSRYTLERHETLHGPLPTARVCWLATEEDHSPVRGADFSGSPTALIVGRIDRHEGCKGHSELIDCWPQVRASVPGARLVIAGGGSGLAEIRARAAASPAASDVDILGYVPQNHIEALFAQAHVFAMPSRQEGFGIAYVEAMRHGVPVIASQQDAGKEINLHGSTGLNVDLARPSDLPIGLIALLGDKNKAMAMGAAAARRWANHFRYAHFRDRFLTAWAEFDEFVEKNAGAK